MELVGKNCVLQVHKCKKEYIILLSMSLPNTDQLLKAPSLAHSYYFTK